jgi:hypothetical protein
MSQCFAVFALRDITRELDVVWTLLSNLFECFRVDEQPCDLVKLVMQNFSE